MIDSRQLNGYELAEFSSNQLSDETIAEWQKSSWLEWANESQDLHPQVYDIGDGNLGYRYMYDHFDSVKLRIAQAGVRLAALLNEIYQ